MFLGEFEHSIDEKGRVAVPARFREELGEGMVLTRGFDLCLQAFPRQVWQQLSQKVSSLSLGSPEARSLRRMLFSNAAEVEVDRQGRILVPQNLREYAGLAEQVVITGMDTYFELWSAERWRAVMDQLDTSGAGIAEQLAALGI
ncbi:division/cell wall cluster transcriptional repressor MraZ [Oscillochloris sp. ZM17-4]|uniref:division/cell wall cluster transcriptional repressor MraZ n=1 Tax=Oscillochloris sp. ZM17-4 TaxID=2866714 RepID=UPI001C72DC0D|nr:division/cell wall cluster transcriptional repressor MraZ [Oscillochloris sp. ZM17-4]